MMFACEGISWESLAYTHTSVKCIDNRPIMELISPLR